MREGSTMLLMLLLGVPVGALLGWASEHAPRLARRETRRMTGEETPGRDGERALSDPRDTRPVPRMGWRNVGIVGVTSGMLAVLTLRFDPIWEHLPAVIASLFFLLVAIIDLEHRLVLDAMVLPAAGLLLLVRVADSGGAVMAALLGAVFGLSPFLLTALVKPGGMGGGDVKLAALVGLAVGFPQVLWALIVAVLCGGIVAFSFLASRRWSASDHIPYAPFLCFGAIVALLYDPVTPLLLSMAR